MEPPAFNPIQFQNEIQTKAEKNGRWNTSQANKADLALCNALMLLDTVALTATVILISNDKVVSKLGTASEVLVILATIFVVMSIFSGILNYINISRFQSRWAQAQGRVVAELAGRLMSPIDINLVLTREQSNLPGRSNQFFWYGQIVTLGLALVLYLAIVIAALVKHV